MSTNHTKNYNLCQWEASDKVLRVDFNEDNAKIDAALARIETTANTAKTDAQAAYSSDNPQVVSGFYTGDGTRMKIVFVPFTPKAALVFRLDMAPNYSNGGTTNYYSGFAVQGAVSTHIAGRTGIAVATNAIYAYQESSGGFATHLNESGQTYCYVAFR